MEPPKRTSSFLLPTQKRPVIQVGRWGGGGVDRLLYKPIDLAHLTYRHASVNIAALRGHWSRRYFPQQAAC